MIYMLDTHVWIWWNMCPEKLSSRVRSLIMATDEYEELIISAITLWEFSKLLEKGRIGISCNPEEWMKRALDMPRLRLLPLSPAVAYRSTCLPQSFHSDPADQIIVATAREENATILTKDRFISKYKYVRTIW